MLSSLSLVFSVIFPVLFFFGILFQKWKQRPKNRCVGNHVDLRLWLLGNMTRLAAIKSRNQDVETLTPPKSNIDTQNSQDTF